MAGEVNFIITIVLLSTMVYCCNKKCSDDTGYHQSLMTKVTIIIGMGCMVLGMSLYYTLGMYNIEIYAPFLIIGMITMLFGACMARRDQNYIPPPSIKRSLPDGVALVDPDTLMWIADMARAQGLLIERRNPENPGEIFLNLRCPTCRYVFDISRTRVVQSIAYCPSCDREIPL